MKACTICFTLLHRKVVTVLYGITTSNGTDYRPSQLTGRRRFPHDTGSAMDAAINYCRVFTLKRYVAALIHLIVGGYFFTAISAVPRSSPHAPGITRVMYLLIIVLIARLYQFLAFRVITILMLVVRLAYYRVMTVNIL